MSYLFSLKFEIITELLNTAMTGIFFIASYQIIKYLIRKENIKERKKLNNLTKNQIIFESRHSFTKEYKKNIDKLFIKAFNNKCNMIINNGDIYVDEYGYSYIYKFNEASYYLNRNIIEIIKYINLIKLKQDVKDKKEILYQRYFLKI